MQSLQQQPLLQHFLVLLEVWEEHDVARLSLVLAVLAISTRVDRIQKQDPPKMAMADESGTTRHFLRHSNGQQVNG